MHALSTPTKLKLIYLFSGMMFWYGIEQLFLNNIIQDPSARAWVTFSFFATLLILDVPGGVFADKFGRKTALVTGSTLLAISLVVLGLSNELWVYVFGAILFGVHWSFANGAAQALLYDHLLESNNEHIYAKQLGALIAYGYIGATIGNILSGLIADSYGLRAPYFLSVLTACFAVYFGLSLKEPKPQKDEDSLASKRGYHWTALYRTFKRRPIALIFSSQIILTIVALATIGEFGQVFILSYDVTAVQLGWIWAAVALVAAIALHQAYRVQSWQVTLMIAFIALLSLFIVIQSRWAVFIFVLTWAVTEVVRNISETDLQHITSSSSRATVLSSVSFLGNLIALPMIWAFDYVLQSQSIHIANSYTSGVLIIVSVFCIAGLLAHRKQPAI